MAEIDFLPLIFFGGVLAIVISNVTINVWIYLRKSKEEEKESKKQVIQIHYPFIITLVIRVFQIYLIIQSLWCFYWAHVYGVLNGEEFGHTFINSQSNFNITLYSIVSILVIVIEFIRQKKLNFEIVKQLKIDIPIPATKKEEPIKSLSQYTLMKCPVCGEKVLPKIVGEYKVCPKCKTVIE